MPDEETPLTDNDWSPQGYGLQFSFGNQLSWQERAISANNLLKKKVESRTFEICMLVFVVVNAMAIGFQIDHEHLLQTTYWIIIDSCFNIVYTLEVCLRIHAYGWSRFIVVPYHVFMVIATALCWFALFGNLAAMETVQALQLFRLVRLQAVCPEIKTLLESLWYSIKGLGWIAILALLLFFMSGCGTTLMIGHKIFQDDATLQSISVNFATIPESMFTLFEVMTLEGWNSYARPFVWSSPVLVAFFIIFVVGANLFLLNFITAVIVDAALRSHRHHDEEEEKLARRDRQQELRRLMNRLHELADREAHTYFHHVQAWVKSDDVLQSCLQKIGWKVSFFLAVVDFCDETDGEVSLSRLNTALQDLQGQLTTTSYIHFQQQVAKRMEYVDQLCVLMLQSVAATLDLPVSEPK